MDGGWPWLVKTSNGCGGTILSPNWVITAAHCCKDEKVIKFKVGEFDLKHNSGHDTVGYIKSDSFIIHPEYDEVEVLNDLCLIYVTPSIEFNDYVSSACVPGVGTAPEPGTECFIAGWGSDDYDVLNYPSILNEAAVPIVDIDTCGRWIDRYSKHGVHQKHPITAPELNDVISNLNDISDHDLLSGYNDPITGNIFYTNIPNDRLLCAGYAYGHVDTCLGDSGGPLICVEDNKPVLHGIVSWGIQCGRPQLPGMYVRVATFTDWIRNQTSQFANFSKTSENGKNRLWKNWVGNGSCTTGSIFPVLLILMLL